MDAVFGTFGELDHSDHETFGCRVGPVQGQVEPAATTVDAAQPYDDSPFWGRKLTREEALDHPGVGEFWDVVDFILVSEPLVEHHVYHRR